MKRKKLIIMIGCIILFCSSLSVFAAFIFNRIIDGGVESGKIEIISEGYISYALNQNVNFDSRLFKQNEYKAILKERAGVSKVNDVNVNNGLEITDSNVSNYYEKKETTDSSIGQELFVLDEFGNFIHINDNNNDKKYDKYYYFEKATKINTNSEYYRLGHKYVSTPNENNISMYYTLSGIDSQEYGIYDKAQNYDVNEQYFTLEYEPTSIKADGTITSGENAGLSCVNTYATERNLNSLESNYMYLNQLGFKFKVKTGINAYLRVKFFDAWISSQLYPGASKLKEVYIKKDQISGRSPFEVNANNWYYDQVNNCCYMTIPISSSEEIKEYTFNINESYFSKTAPAVYKENIYVQVSYSLELIQANRALTVWGVDPSVLGGVSNEK